MVLEERMHAIKRNGEIELEQKLPTPANQNNGIKTDVVVVYYIILYYIILYVDESNLFSVTSEPSQRNSRCVSSFKDSSALMNSCKTNFVKVKSF